MANDSKYGLHAAVLGTHLQCARRVASQIRSGRVVINAMMDDPQAPWEGYSTGVGHEYGRLRDRDVPRAQGDPRAILRTRNLRLPEKSHEHTRHHFTHGKPPTASRFENPSRLTHTAPIAATQEARWLSSRRTPISWVYMNAKDPTPSMELHSRDALAPVFADLNRYDATTHFVGQSTITSLSGDPRQRRGVLPRAPRRDRRQQRHLMVASPRYNDTFVKTDGAWLFSERLLYVDWVDERALA